MTQAESKKKYYEKNKKRWVEYSRKYRQDPVKRAKAVFMSIRSRAKNKDIEFTLAFEDIYPYPEKCPILGIPLVPGGSSGVNSPDSPSVDRIDPTKGYTKENCQVISNRANFLKNNGTIEEFEKILAYLRNLEFL